MKRTALLILPIILSACATPIAQGPTATSLATATQQSLPTATLTPLPTATMVKNTPTVEAKNEKEPLSCVDPAAIAQQDTDFKARTEIDLNNLDVNEEGKKFAQALESVQHIAFHPEQGVVGFSMIKTGMSIVDIEDAAGVGIDKVVCIYGRTGVIPGETISVVVGWVGNNGKFQSLADGVDSYHRRNMDRDQLLDFFKKLPDGAVLTWRGVHTFSGVTSPDEIVTPFTKWFPDQPNFVRRLLQALGNQLLERMSGVANIDEYWATMDPQVGDQGFITAGQFNYFDQFDLK